VFAAALSAGMSWLARGIARLALACACVIAVTALALQLISRVGSSASFAMAWLIPTSLLAVIVSLVLLRRAELAFIEVFQRTIVELLSAATALTFALYYASQITSLGARGPSRVLFSSEDNDAWLNVLADLQNRHGQTVDAARSFGSLGPVVPTYLSFVRAATEGFGWNSIPNTLHPQIVTSAHALLFIAMPIAAAGLTARALAQGRFLQGIVVWATVTAVLFANGFILAGYGFLSASLAVLLALVAVCAVNVDALDWGVSRPTLSWAIVALLIYGVGGAWFPIAPLAAVGIGCWCMLAIVRTRVAQARFPPAGLITLVAISVASSIALLTQYGVVADPNGGSTGLLKQQGGTPHVYAGLVALGLALFAFAWLTSPPVDGSVRERSPLWMLIGLGLYAAVVMLYDSHSTQTAPHYGATKLMFISFAVWLPVAIAEVHASAEFARRRLDAALALASIVLLTCSLQSAPLWTAAQQTWPRAFSEPAWLDAVNRQVTAGKNVLCLDTTVPKPGYGSLVAYQCSRWATSLVGKHDDPDALGWMYSILGIQPISHEVSELAKPSSQMWTIVVIGPIERLANPSAWWVPLLAQSNVRVASAG
jgi:hypothetical protein